MPRACVLGALLALSACAASGGPPHDPRAAEWANPSPDFGKIRTELRARDDFAALCEADSPLRELYGAADAKDWQRVLELGVPWLDGCPVDIDAHLLTAIAYRELGHPKEAEAHHRWYRGLVESVLASGDGRSPERPFRVISVGEEYAVLRALRVHREGEARLEGGIEALTVRDQDGAQSTIYFAPSARQP